MSSHQTASVYVRASIPNPVRERVYDQIDRLEALEEGGALDSVQITTWETGVPTDDAARFDRPAVAAYERFRTWAARRDRSLAPGFSVRDDADETLRVPVVCVAIRDDGELSGVYPSERPDGTVETVEDGIDQLERSWQVVV